MNLNNVLTILKNELNNVGEELLLAKEPSEHDSDIDLFITNRFKSTAEHLIKHSPVPLYFTHKKRGFAYYLSKSGIIKAIDLYDAPFISDATIDWFSSRSENSCFNPVIKVLSQEDQAAHLIYKALRKGKPKRDRYKKIIDLIKNIEIQTLRAALLTLCERQNESKNVLQNATRAVQLIYSKNCSFECFSKIIQRESTDIFAAKRIMRFIQKIKRGILHLRHTYFLMNSCQGRVPMVCIVGVDGVGKSSTINALASSLEKIYYVQTRMETKTSYHIITKVYMNNIKSVFDIITTLLSKSELIKLFNIGNNFKLRAYLLIVYFDTKKKIDCLLKKSNGGIVVIIDRWWSDLFIAKTQSFLLEKSPNILTKFLSLPRPDLFVLIEIPAEISIKRRPDEDLKKLSQKKEALLAFMSQHFESNLLTIKGDGEINDNVKQIHRRLYGVWYDLVIKRKRFSTGEII